MDALQACRIEAETSESFGRSWVETVNNSERHLPPETGDSQFPDHDLVSAYLPALANVFDEDEDPKLGMVAIDRRWTTRISNLLLTLLSRGGA
jgi:hypothetical protein